MTREAAAPPVPPHTSSLAYLEGLGWVPPDEDECGVKRCCRIDEAAISYPPAAYDDAGAGDDADQGFYLSHRSDVVVDVLSRLGVTCLWEVGAGNGNMAVPLARSGREVVAVEPLMGGAAVSARHGVTSICGTLEDLQLPDASLPAVGLFDVLEHLRSPTGLVREVHRVLRPGGILVVTVPAGPWLWSDLDEALGHFRRYRRRALVEEVAPVGFRVLSAEYIYACLAPAAAVMRALPYRLGRRKSEAEVIADVQQELNVPGALDQAARLVLRLERRVSRVMPLPFGLSVLAAFRKT